MTTRADATRETRLSVCIIAKNEEASIARAIDSVRDVASEILVLDTGSTDATVAVAEAHGARVLHFAWTGSFSDARNEILSHAEGDWIFILDADHEATDTCRARVLATLARTKADGVYAPQLNVHDDGTVTPFHALHFVRNGKGYRYRGRVHEEIENSILDHGATIDDADLPVLHHGYTREEDARKGRRERNLKLLREAVEDDPTDARMWHYLALELLMMHQHDEALVWLERIVTERPDSRMLGWSASLLAGELRRRGARAAAWRAAIASIQSADAPALGWAHLGAIAADEGDHVLAEAAAQELGRPQRRHRSADIGDRPGLIAQLRGAALVERGEHAAAIELLERAVRASPNNAPLVELYVRAIERVDGPMGAFRRAIRAVPSPLVASTIAGAFVRADAPAKALEIARATGAMGIYGAMSQLRAGDRASALDFLRAGGETFRVHRTLWGLEVEDAAALAEATQDAGEVARALVSRVRAAKPIAPNELALRGLARTWIDTAVEFRLRMAAQRLAAPLPGGAGVLAVALAERGLGDEALRLALDFPDDPGAARVIGLSASARGEVPIAAEFLLRATADEEAPIRVYAKAAAALARVGRVRDAAGLLERGMRAWPGSLLLDRIAA
jgi:tetratricopeptide (TPR) repeat protein